MCEERRRLYEVKIKCLENVIHKGKVNCIKAKKKLQWKEKTVVWEKRRKNMKSVIN